MEKEGGLEESLSRTKKHGHIERFSGAITTSILLVIIPPTVRGEESFTHTQYLDFHSVVDKQTSGSRYSHIWGKENMEFTPEKELKISYPEGSYSPQNSPMVGGAGFIYKLDTPLNFAKLSYEVKFGKGFDFVLGGKLPGLCSLDCPRGGSDMEKGFSARFMWRKDGDMEAYAYVPEKKGKYGESFGRGSFRFESGRYYALEQILKLNTPGENDGLLIIVVDGKEVFRDNHVKFYNGSSVKIDSFLFSTFFGGATSNYGASKEEKIYFKNFKIQ